MKTRSIVSAIVAAALSVVLCVGLLVGTTVAWFTDTVSSTGNSITAGALAVELNDGSSEALFTSDTVWAPGTSQRRSVRVENVGSVALRYSIAARNIVTSGDADLSSALNVYKTATGAEVAEGTLLGTLADLAGNAYGNDGTLAVGASETFDIVIEMPGTVGDEYQNCGVTFDLCVTATQTDASIITSADELDTALGQASEGDTVVVSDVTYTQALTIDKAITLAGYNFTVEAPVSVTADNAVIENVTVSVSGTTRAASGAALTVNAAGVTLEGVVVDAGAGIQPVSVTSTEGFTMQGCTIGGNLSGTNAFVALNVNGAAVIEDNVLDGKADAESGISYNALEFCVSNTAYSVGDGTVISGNTIRNFSNNGINIYCIQDGAVISVEGNVFENVSNAMRLSNVSNNAKTATFNIANNRHNESNALEPNVGYAGFVFFQNFGSAEDPQLFTGFTLNFSGNTADGAALQNNSWYTAANDRAFYVYENAYADANGGALNPDTENLPTVSMN